MPEQQPTIPKCPHGVPLGEGCAECTAATEATHERELLHADEPISFQDIVEAQQIMRGAVERTPLIEIENGVLLKMENLHEHVNAFKIRGAYNRLIREPSQEVVTAAVGSHGFAVGEVCGKLKKRAKCFMPENAPAEKREKMRAIYGTDRVIVVGKEFKGAEEAALQHAQEQKIPFIHPYNDRHVVAGQGVIGLEIAEDMEGISDQDITVYVPVAGGGMFSGIAIALRKQMPRVRIIGVQPETMHAMQKSVEVGTITAVEQKPSLAEPLAVNLNPETITLEYIRRHADGFILVAEEEIRDAMRAIFEKTNQRIEGAGAVAYAAMHKDPEKRKKSICIVSGGNINEERFNKIMREQEKIMPPLSIEEIEHMELEELARSGRLESLSEEILDELSDEALDNLRLARGILRHEKDNERFEAPQENAEIHFYPDIKKIFSRDPRNATFFVQEILPGEVDETKEVRLVFPGEALTPSTVPKGAERKIIIVFTPYVQCYYGTCGISVLPKFNKEHFPRARLQEVGIGSITKTRGEKIEIEWGSGSGTQTPNLEDQDYHGPYPGKFAEWVKQQILAKVKDIIGETGE